MILVSPPKGKLVSLDDLKQHLRVSHCDEDFVISSLNDAALQKMDGWSGDIGRAIQEQVWRQELPMCGRATLALPDVKSTRVYYFDDNGSDISVSHKVYSYGGFSTLEAEEDLPVPAWIEMTCALPKNKIELAKMALKMLVGHWYENREAVSGNQKLSEVPLTYTAIVQTLKWYGP